MSLRSCMMGALLAACGGTTAAAPAAPAPGPPAPDAGASAADASAQAQASTADASTAAADGGPLPSETPLGAYTPIEDPGGEALAAFYHALGRTAAGEEQTRIAFYGASHVASDLFTGVIRDALQARFGDAGPGFVLPAKPWAWHRHDRFRFVRSRGWRALRVRAHHTHGGRYGLAGVAIRPRRKFARGIIETRGGESQGHVERFELFYAEQPDGGHLLVLIDGKRAARIDTEAPRVQTAYKTFAVEDGRHRFEVRAQGDGPVRIYGVAAERDAPGVILDTLGIPGARVRYHLHWDEDVYREHLARRRPDLVVLAYGTNEAGDDDVPIEHYESNLREALALIQQTVPDASCLLVGPSDRPVRIRPEDEGAEPTYEDRPRTHAIVETQRRVAREVGCAFFDVVRFMGGPLSMVRWVSHDPQLGAPDHVHYTRRGYERLGEVLAEALLENYEPGAAAEAIAERTSGRSSDAHAADRTEP